MAHKACNIYSLALYKKTRAKKKKKLLASDLKCHSSKRVKRQDRTLKVPMTEIFLEKVNIRHNKA